MHLRSKVEKGYGSRAIMSNPKDSTKEYNFGFVYMDHDFIPTLGIKLEAGENFRPGVGKVGAELFNSASKMSPADFADRLTRRKIIITDKIAEIFNLSKPYVGQQIYQLALQGTVIVVISDFKSMSLLQKSPMIVFKASPENSSSFTYIRISPHHVSNTLQYIEKTQKKLLPQNDFDYSFMDDTVASLYQDQQQLGTMFSVFAGLAIFISLMGLFSLVAQSAQQRTKEIGIRKVLGASVGQISSLLLSDFIKLIAVAFVVATPIAWWAMNHWLQDFQYRINIGWVIFALTGISCLLLSLLTVGYQALKAAIANPVESIRTE